VFKKVNAHWISLDLKGSTTAFPTSTTTTTKPTTTTTRGLLQRPDSTVHIGEKAHILQLSPTTQSPEKCNNARFLKSIVRQQNSDFSIERLTSKN